jgi:hypothetical protein
VNAAAERKATDQAKRKVKDEAVIACKVAAEEHTAAYAIAAPAIAHVLQRMQLQVPCFSAQRATWPPNTLLNDVTYFLI